MATYPKQLVNDLVQQLDLELVNFFERSKRNFSVQSITEVVESILTTDFSQPDGTSMKFSADGLKYSAEKVLKRYQNAKINWFKAYTKNRETYPDPSLTKSIFHTYYEQYKILSYSEWTALHGEKDLVEVIESKHKEVLAWKKERGALLISFPLIHTKRKDYVYRAFLLDVARDVYKTIKKEYHGDLNGFFRPYPQELVDKPLFSPDKGEIALHLSAGQLIDDFYPSEGKEPALRTIANPGMATDNMLRSFDWQDIKILSTVISNVDNDFYSTRRISLPLASIASLLYEVGNPSEWHYEEAARRCLDLGQRSFKYYPSKNIPGVMFNFFDTITVDPSSTSGKRNVTFEVGSLLYRTIVDRKLINVTSRNYDALDNALSKIIYYVLQRERVAMGIQNREHGTPMIRSYAYSFFSHSVRFRRNNIGQNIKLINGALDDFVQKKIAVKNYTAFSDVHWDLEFFPLSDAEYADLQFEQKMVSLP